MNKISTIFERNWEGNRGVINQETVSSTDLLQAIPTEKIDGTNVRATVRNHMLVRLEKRRNPDKIQKAKGITEPWYIDADEYDKNDQWIWDAIRNTSLSDVPDGEWSAEAVGPDIQGNPLNLTANRVFFFSLPEVRAQLNLDGAPVKFTELKEWMGKQKSRVGIDAPIEGIVWWENDEPIGKIKLKDFK
jgi:hypothetical protein